MTPPLATSPRLSELRRSARVLVSGVPVVVAVLLAACSSIPAGDAYLAAEARVRRGELLDALIQLDRVPPAHPHYAEARTLAQAIERRIRTSHDLIQKGLALRSEWRDEEALEAFRAAAAVWGAIGGVRELSEATRNRIAALERAGSGERVPQARTQVVPPSTAAGEAGTEGASGTTATAPSPGGVGAAPAPLGEMPPASPGGAASGGVVTTDGDPSRTASPGREAAAAVPSSPPISAAAAEQAQRLARLREAQQHLERGEMARAMEILEQLSAHAPEDPQLSAMLVRVLHQRALLRYGQGWLELAITDWSRVLELRPDDRAASDFVAAARAELARRTER